MKQLETEIKEIKINAAGLSADEAKQLGAAIGEELSKSLPALSKPLDIAQLSIRLSASYPAETGRMAKQVAAQILEKIRWQLL